MNIPPAAEIENAVEDLKSVDPKVLADQLRELHEAVGLHPDDEVGYSYEDGYNLGLQVARRIIASSAEILIHDADPTKIL